MRNKKRTTAIVLVGLILTLCIVVCCLNFCARLESENRISTETRATEVGVSEVALNFANLDTVFPLEIDMWGGGWTPVNFTSFMKIKLLNSNSNGDGQIYGEPAIKNITLMTIPDVKKEATLNINCDISLNFTPKIKVETSRIPTYSDQGIIGHQHNINAVYRHGGVKINGVNQEGFLGEKIVLKDNNFNIYESGNYTKNYSTIVNIQNNSLKVEYDLLYFDDEFIGDDCIGNGWRSVVRKVVYNINFNIKKDSPLKESDYAISSAEKRNGIYYINKNTSNFLELKEKEQTIQSYNCTKCGGGLVLVSAFNWRCGNCDAGYGSDRYGNCPVTSTVIKKMVYNSSIRIGNKIYKRNSITAGDVASQGENKVITVTPILWSGVECESVKVVFDSTKPSVNHNGEIYAKNINLGGFNVAQKFNFNENLSSAESSETAQITFYPIVKRDLKIKISETGETFNYQSGTELKADGKYYLSVTDKCGNKTQIEFFIMQNFNGFNLSRITDYSYLDIESYSVSFKSIAGSVNLIESGKLGKNTFNGLFENSKTYLFKNYNEALTLAKEVETEFYVTKTSENTYSYKVPNSSLMMEYSDMDALSTAIEFYAKKYVTQTAVKRESPYSDFTKIIVMDESLKLNSNELTPLTCGSKKAFYIAPEFKFTKNTISTTTASDSFKDSLNITITEVSSGKEVNFNFDKAFGEMTFKEDNSLVTSGYYLVTEQDSFKNEQQYYVFLNLEKPTLCITTESAGEQQQRTINAGDITNIYTESLQITNENESNQAEWLIIEVKNDANNSQNGIYYKNFPLLTSESGKGGMCRIRIWDRSLNTWEFEIYIAGEAPRAVFSVNGDGDEAVLKISINKGANFNIITGLEIYADGKRLTVDDGTEVVTSSGTKGEPAKEINFSNLEYYFKTSAVYFVIITDNFGRTSYSPKLKADAEIPPTENYMTKNGYEFVKNPPKVTISGVRDGGRTGNNVVITFPVDCAYELTFNDVLSDLTAKEDIQLNVMKITIEASIETSGKWNFKAIKIDDTHSFATLEFWINKYPPEIYLVNSGTGEKVESGGYSTSGVYVKISEEDSSNFSSACYFFNSNKFSTSFALKNEIKRTGEYRVVVTDKQGNTSELYFTIDNSVEFVFLNGGKEAEFFESEKKINGETVLKTTKTITYKPAEDIRIVATFNGERINFVPGQTAEEEGIYTFILTDYFNNVKTVVIEIDRTAPKLELSASGKTRENITVTADMNDIDYIRITKDGIRLDVAFNGTYTFTESAVYEIIVRDDIKNERIITFEIDRFCDYTSNIFNNGITTGSVSITLKENLIVEAIKDGEKIEFGKTFKTHGVYKLNFTDELGNADELNFVILAKTVNSFKYTIPKNLQVEVVKDGEKVEVVIFDDVLKLSTDGEYEIKLTGNDKIFRLSVIVDTIAPELKMSVRNGSTTRKTVKFGSLSEKCEVQIYKDGKLTDLKISDKVKESGEYRIVLTDNAGNSTEYSFIKKFKFNVGAFITSILLVLVIGFCAWRIIRVKKSGIK